MILKNFIVINSVPILGFKTNQEAYLACGVPRSTFYDWKKAYDEAGEEGLKQKKSGDRHHPGKLSD